MRASCLVLSALGAFCVSAGTIRRGSEPRDGSPAPALEKRQTQSDTTTIPTYNFYPSTTVLLIASETSSSAPTAVAAVGSAEQVGSGGSSTSSTTLTDTVSPPIASAVSSTTDSAAPSAPDGNQGPPLPGVGGGDDAAPGLSIDFGGAAEPSTVPGVVVDISL